MIFCDGPCIFVKTSLSSVCVYCGSRTGSQPVYANAARQFGRLFSDMNIEIIYGGGSLGLMGIMAREAIDNGGKVTGVIPTFMDEASAEVPGLSRIFRTQTMHERKQKMEDLSDGFVVLPGGFGTLDEAIEIITWKQLNLHQKPVVFCNIAGYWDLFTHMIENVMAQGFIDSHHLRQFRIVDQVEEIYPALVQQLPQ